MQKFNIKIGDIVQVISGFDKKKIGKIIKLNRKTGKIIVEGINLRYKHIKPKTDKDIGDIKQIEVPLHHSNVKLNLIE